MKLTLTPGERPALLGSLGLLETASDADLSAAVAARLTETESTQAAAVADAPAPDEYPAEWLSPSQLAPWPRPIPSGQRVTHGGD